MLKLAIIRVRDDNGEVDEILLESELKDIVAGELERKLRWRGKQAAQIARDAFGLAKKLDKLGWTLREEREPQVREATGRKNAATQVLVEEGYFSATKRHDGGNTLVQFESDTEAGLLAQVEGWENEQAVATAEPNPDERAYKE